jgi:hypothetical protein
VGRCRAGLYRRADAVRPLVGRQRDEDHLGPVVPLVRVRARARALLTSNGLAPMLALPGAEVGQAALRASLRGGDIRLEPDATRLPGP